MPTSRRAEPRRIRFPFFVYAIAVLIRLIPVLLTRDLGIGLDDMFQYDMLARSLAAGHGFRWYAPADLDRIVWALRQFGVAFDVSDLPSDPLGIPTSFRAPLYPAFLAVVYSFQGLGGRFFAARLVQAFMMGTLAPLTYALARQLGASERASRLAAWALAFWPMLVFFPLGLATENLFLPLLAAATLAVFRAAQTSSLRAFALAGAFLGLATLTRSVIVVFPVLAAIWLWILRQRKGAIILLGIVVAFTLPWSLRNSLLHGKPTFVETSLGYNLYLGYHPQGDGSFIFGPSLDLVPILDDAERDAAGRDLALTFIRQNPERVPWLMIRKLGHLWGLEDRAFAYFYSNGLVGDLPSAAVVALFLILVLPLVFLIPASLVGLVTGKHDRPWQATLCLLASYTAVHMLVMAEERFHLALLPMMAALAGRGLSNWPSLLAGVRQGQPGSRREVVIILVLLGLMVLNWTTELVESAPRLAVLFGPGGSSAHFNY